MVRQAQKEGQAKAASPEVARVASSIKKSDAKDFASTKHKGLPMKKESAISEEGYDRMRDKKLEQGTWKGGKSNYKAPYETDKQRSDRMKKSAANSMKALNIVKDGIRKKYGKGAIMGEENLSELDKKTLGSYVRKSSASMAGAAIDNDMKKVGKRYSGIQKATKKMAEHHEKDENGKVIEHEVEDTTPSSVEEAAYTGPDKKDRAVINKMYDKKGNKTDFAKKAAEYEKNMDPKKRQALKDKATKGMKFTHEEAVSEAKYEAGASDYGKTSIRNKRAFGKGGNAADPKERGGAKMLRHDSHTKRRGVKKNNKYGATNKPPVDGAPSDEFKKNKNVSEGSLHKWFKGSKSKDGKGGWVNVVTGGTCASDKPGEGTPKCVSSSKRASMSKAERLSASRRKKKADPGQQSKSGAAKPTYVATDSKKKK